MSYPAGSSDPYRLPRDDGLAPATDGWWRVSRRVAVLVTVLVGLVVVVVLVVLGWSTLRQGARESARDAEVRTVLWDADHAMAVYRQTHHDYPNDVRTLESYGFQPDPDVDVEIVGTGGPAGLLDYCLSGSAVGRGPSYWLAGSTGLTTIPCG